MYPLTSLVNLRGHKGLPSCEGGWGGARTAEGEKRAGAEQKGLRFLHAYIHGKRYTQDTQAYNCHVCNSLGRRDATRAPLVPPAAYADTTRHRRCLCAVPSYTDGPGAAAARRPTKSHPADFILKLKRTINLAAAR